MEDITEKLNDIKNQLSAIKDDINEVNDSLESKAVTLAEGSDDAEALFCGTINDTLEALSGVVSTVNTTLTAINTVVASANESITEIKNRLSFLSPLHINAVPSGDTTFDQNVVLCNISGDDLTVTVIGAEDTEEQTVVLNTGWSPMVVSAVKDATENTLVYGY